MAANATLLDNDARQKSPAAKQVSRWNQDDLSGAESAGANSEGASSRLYRVVQAAHSDESNIPSSILRSSRQPTNSSIDENDAQVSPQPTGASRLYRSHGEQTGYKMSNWRNQASGNTGGLVSNMAKLFQSRENLDKISSRERFVADGLAMVGKAKPVASARASLSANHKPTCAIPGRPEGNTSADDDGDGDDDDDEEDAEVKQIAQRQVSPMRSRSLGRRAATKGSIRYPGGSVAEPPMLAKRLDWRALDASQVELSRELCQQLIEELQMISKFVTRLHPRLQAPERRDLASLVARGVQNSMDILSIVPARSLSNQRLASSSGLSSATLQARGQSQVSLVPKRRGQSQVAGNQGRASSMSRPGSATGQRSALPAMSRQSRADTMARGRTQARPGRNEPLMTRTTSSGSGLNIDQVLEAYSDRLFRMVQERMAVGGGGGGAEQRASEHLR